MGLVQTTSDITKHLIPYIVLVCGDRITLVQSTSDTAKHLIPYIVLVCGDGMTLVQSISDIAKHLLLFMILKPELLTTFSDHFQLIGAFYFISFTKDHGRALTI